LRPSLRSGHRSGHRGRQPRATIAADAGLDGRSAIASFARYADAERAVDGLTAGRFPVHRTVLVGGDLKLVEEVTGRLTGTRAVCLGGVAGAWLGALMALFAVVADRPVLAATASLLVWGVLLGALFGATLGAAAYGATGRTRDFTSRRRLVAGRYDLYADDEVADAARRLLLQWRPAGMRPLDLPEPELVPLPDETYPEVA